MMVLLPVASEDDPSIRQVSGDVLVLDGLQQGQLDDGPVLHGSDHAHEGELAGGRVWGK